MNSLKDKIIKLIADARKFEKEKGLITLENILKNYDKKEYPTKLGKFSEKISSTGETAYQRAIFSSKKTKLNTIGEVVWNDIELPVIFNDSSRRNCVDLIGTLNSETPVLCELKFTSQENKSSQSPIYAAIELLIYYYLIQDNHEELEAKEVFHKNQEVKRFKWSTITSKSILVVGANETYWTNWQARYQDCRNDVKSWCISLLPLEIRFFSSSDFNFKVQKEKESNKKYQPKVSDNGEWTEVYF